MADGRISWLLFVCIALTLTGIVAKTGKIRSMKQKIVTAFYLLFGIVVLGSVAKIIGFLQIVSTLSYIELGLIMTIEYILLANCWIEKIPEILQLK